MNFRHPIARKPLKKSRKPIARSPIRKRPRKKSEFARIYGSKARVEFVKGLQCIGCGYWGFKTENAHIKTGGTGRKADACFIVPLCGNGVDFNYGCHHELHQYGPAIFERNHRLDLEEEAAKVEAAWVIHQSRLEDTEPT